MTQAAPPNWGQNVASGGTYIKPADTMGFPLIVWVLQHVPQAGPTPRRTQGSDAIELDIVKLNPQNPAQSEVYRSQLWRTGRIIGKLKQFVGRGPCLVTVYDERPNDQTSRTVRSLADDQAAVELANGWYASLGEEGFAPSEATDPNLIYQRAVAQMTQGQQAAGWPPGAMPAQQYYAQQQQGGGWGGQQVPQQGGWGAPAPGPQQGGWGAPAPAGPPPQQGGWGAPAQQAQPHQGGWGGQPAAPQQGWGGQQAAPAPQQGGWGAPAQQQPPAAPGGWGAPQQVAPPANNGWGAPQQGWGGQQAPAGPPPQQGGWGAPPNAQPPAGPPQQSPAPQQQAGPSMLDMIAGGQPGTGPVPGAEGAGY